MYIIIYVYMYIKLCVRVCISASYNSYLPVIGVHEMHGRMHPNYWQITILLVVDLCSSLAYFMMTQPLPIAGKFTIKTLVAKQLPTIINIPIPTCRHTYYSVVLYAHAGQLLSQQRRCLCWKFGTYMYVYD